MGVFEIDENFQPNADGYDSLMYWPPLLEYYCHSEFVNFGYWCEDTRNAGEAAENLMEKLLELIPVGQGTILDVACGKWGRSCWFTLEIKASDKTRRPSGLRTR